MRAQKALPSPSSKGARPLLPVAASLLSGGGASLVLIALVVAAQRLAILYSVLELGTLGPRAAALFLTAAAALSLVRSRAALRLAHRVRRNLLTLYLEPLERIPAPLLPRGELVVARLSVALSTLVGFSIDGIAVFLGALIALFPMTYWLAAELSPAALLPIGAAGLLGAAATLILSARVESAWSRAWSQARALLANMGAVFEGAVDLCAHGRESAYKQRLLDQAAVWSATEGRARMQSAAVRWGTLVFTLGSALVLGALLSPQWLSSEREGGLYKTFLIIIACVPTLQSLSGSLANIWYSRSDLESLAELAGQSSRFIHPSEGDDNAAILPKTPVEIQFNQIEFEYPSQDGSPAAPVFQGRPITVRLPARGLIALTGKNGAGKTTLLYLMAGLLTPTRGSIELESRRQSLRNRSWHEGIAFLSQRPFYQKDESIAAALRAFDPDKSDAGLMEALERAGIADVLLARAKSPERALSMTMAELSAGEARRVLFARVLLRDAHTLLLDEPDTHLDGEALRRLGELLQKLAQEKRVVVAAHEPALLSLCDQRIDLGEAEPGSPP